MAKISQSLRETVEANENINEVYFTMTNHYFHKKQAGDSKDYARVYPQAIMDKKTGKAFTVYFGKEEDLIIETMTREQILSKKTEETFSKK